MNQLKAELRAQVKAQFRNPYKVGDILHHSWGYDQTNCDFYQVVGIKTASVILRKIGAQTIPGSEGFMSETVLPVKDAFVTKGVHALTDFHSCNISARELTPEQPTITKRVVCYIANGMPRYYIPVPYGWCDLWEGKPEYSSWYA